MIRLVSLLTLGLVLAGCTTPYPNADPFYEFGASVDANRAPRGSKAFCDRYARQSAANYYESNRDSDDSFGSNGFIYSQAGMNGDRAYQRCLAGRTN